MTSLPLRLSKVIAEKCRSVTVAVCARNPQSLIIGYAPLWTAWKFVDNTDHRHDTTQADDQSLLYLKSSSCLPLSSEPTDKLLYVQARSLLTSHEDFVTLLFHSSTEIQKPGLVWAFLKRNISEAVVEEVQRMTLTLDACSAVFDVPANRAQVFHSSPSAWLAQGFLGTDCVRDGPFSGESSRCMKLTSMLGQARGLRQYPESN